MASKKITCAHCGKEKLSKDEIALNKKLNHPQIQRTLCLVCMAVDMETTEEELHELIMLFKREGCALFG